MVVGGGWGGGRVWVRVRVGRWGGEGWVGVGARGGVG